jgi:hypothetical protein
MSTAMSTHAIDNYPSSKGCNGIENCVSCAKRLAAVIPELESGAAYDLPFDTLFVWEDGTFTTVPRLNPRLN